MRIVYWGTYDLGKPRNRINIKGLKENGVELLECHKDVWGGVEDKSQISGLVNKIRFSLSWLFAYPFLIWRYLRLPKHDCVIVGYMGHLDVLFLWPFARLRGVPIIWDAFLSLYNTVVEDRNLAERKQFVAWLLFVLEWIACRLATKIVLDTHAHGDYFVKSYNLDAEKVKRVFVGAEDLFFAEAGEQEVSEVKGKLAAKAAGLRVLFYGQFIPLHGIEYIVSAAKLTQSDNVQWILIGKGQEKSKVDKLILEESLSNLVCYDWVPYQQLPAWISSVDVCLGIFGDTDKARRVIPNKVFQVLAVGVPLVTGDTPAVRELCIASDRNVRLVPLADPAGIAEAVLSFKREVISANCRSGLSGKAVSPQQVGAELKKVLLEIRGRD